jgi:hypothetical protein
MARALERVEEIAAFGLGRVDLSRVLVTLLPNGNHTGCVFPGSSLTLTRTSGLATWSKKRLDCGDPALWWLCRAGATTEQLDGFRQSAVDEEGIQTVEQIELTQQASPPPQRERVEDSGPPAAHGATPTTAPSLRRIGGAWSPPTRLRSWHRFTRSRVEHDVFIGQCSSSSLGGWVAPAAGGGHRDSRLRVGRSISRGRLLIPAVRIRGH